MRVYRTRRVRHVRNETNPNMLFICSVKDSRIRSNVEDSRSKLSSNKDRSSSSRRVKGCRWSEITSA